MLTVDFSLSIRTIVPCQRVSLPSALAAFFSGLLSLADVAWPAKATLANTKASKIAKNFIAPPSLPNRLGSRMVRCRFLHTPKLALHRQPALESGSWELKIVLLRNTG